MSSRTQLLTTSNLRLDSRLPLELRSISFQILPSPPSTSSLSSLPSLTSTPPAQADGYAIVSHGLTRISSSIFGPRESMRSGAFSSGGGGGGTGRGGEKASVNVEVGVAGWSERVNSIHANGGVRKGGKDRRTVELATAIQATFEPVLLLHLYPRSSIDIYIQILEVDGSLLQAAINATTLALISAGLPLLDYICALTLASYPSQSSTSPQITPFELTSPSVPHSNSETGTKGSGSTTLIDLCQAEENVLPCLTVAILPRSGKISLVSLETRVGVGRFEEMLRWGVEGSKVVQEAMEEAVAEWAESLAAPSKNLASLFPGISGSKSSGGKDGDEMEE